MSQLLRCLSTDLPYVFLALTAQLRNARVQKVYTSCGLRPTTKNRFVHLWTLTKIWSLQSLRLRMPWVESSTSFQYSQLYKGSVVSRLTSTISQSSSIYHAWKGASRTDFRVQSQCFCQCAASRPIAAASLWPIPWEQYPMNTAVERKLSNWKLQHCSRVNWAKYSRKSAYLVKILIETVPMKAIHIYIYTYMWLYVYIYI